MKGYIYEISFPDGKKYIGQTINLPNRKSSYKHSRFKNQKRLWNYCQKYNLNPFYYLNIIEEINCEDKFILNEREKYWIEFYDSIKNGFNCTPGGDGIMGYKHTDEAKEKISKANKGKKLSEETKEKVRQANLGLKHPHTDEAKEKISNSLKGREGKPHSEETKQKLREMNVGELSPKFGKKYPHSDEAKERMRLAYKKRLENKKNLE